MIVERVRFRRAIGVPSRALDDRVILARPGREDFDALTGPAVAIWNLLQEPRTLIELVDTLAWAYKAPRAEIERDIRTLVGDLLERGIVVESQDPDA
ncbi:MAG: PqqD family protein [Actinomycetota bacterium]